MDKDATMEREYVWNITIRGIAHQIGCRFAGDRYELYADGVYAVEVLRDRISTMWDGMQKPVSLFGKECLFVVMDEVPDLVIDGIMVRRKRSYEKVLCQRARRPYVGYGVLLGSCVLLLVAVVWLLVSGRGQQTGWYNIFIALGAAVTMGAWSVKNMWKLTQAHSSSGSKTIP